MHIALVDPQLGEGQITEAWNNQTFVLLKSVACKKNHTST